MGVQLHLSSRYAPLIEADFASALAGYAKLGLRIHLTEIDASPDTEWLYANCTSVTEQLQAAVAHLGDKTR